MKCLIAAAMMMAVDAICGHEPRTVGESYGGVTLAAKAKAMAVFPRFAI